MPCIFLSRCSPTSIPTVTPNPSVGPSPASRRVVTIRLWSRPVFPFGPVSGNPPSSCYPPPQPHICAPPSPLSAPVSTRPTQTHTASRGPRQSIGLMVPSSSLAHCDCGATLALDLDLGRGLMRQPQRWLYPTLFALLRFCITLLVPFPLLSLSCIPSRITPSVITLHHPIPLTPIGLVFLYKALAFTCVYALQFCYHMSLCHFSWADSLQKTHPELLLWLWL